LNKITRIEILKAGRPGSLNFIVNMCRQNSKILANFLQYGIRKKWAWRNHGIFAEKK